MDFADLLERVQRGEGARDGLRIVKTRGPRPLRRVFAAGAPLGLYFPNPDGFTVYGGETRLPDAGGEREALSAVALHSLTYRRIVPTRQAVAAALAPLGLDLPPGQGVIAATNRLLTGSGLCLCVAGGHYGFFPEMPATFERAA